MSVETSGGRALGWESADHFRASALTPQKPEGKDFLFRAHEPRVHALLGSEQELLVKGDATSSPWRQHGVREENVSQQTLPRLCGVFQGA